jgi:chemotaxis protein MotB
MARRQEAHGGGHGWFVTFADLMGLLVSFFVMLVAFSSQDAQKVQAVGGSMREAFGVQATAHDSGIKEIDGLPTRPLVKHVAHIPPEDSSVTPTSDDHGSGLPQDPGLSLAAASLRQALEAMPELVEVSKRILVEEGNEGLNIEIVDQDGRSMFPDRSTQPYPRIRDLIRKIAGPLKQLPFRIAISGHTSRAEVVSQPEDVRWKLAADRANSVRQILEEEGYPSSKIFKVDGRADTDPLFAEDPSTPPNRRVRITLVREAPAVPPDLQP